MRGEGQWRHRLRREPSDLLDFIARLQVPAEQAGAIRKDDDPVVTGDHVLEGQQRQGLDNRTRFLEALAGQGVVRMLVPVNVATRQSPKPTSRLDVAQHEQHAPGLLDQRRHHNFGIAKEDLVAFGTGAQALRPHQPGLGLCATAGAERDHRGRLSRQPAGSTAVAAASLIASPMRNG